MCIICAKIGNLNRDNFKEFVEMVDAANREPGAVPADHLFDLNYYASWYPLDKAGNPLEEMLGSDGKAYKVVDILDLFRKTKE